MLLEFYKILLNSLAPNPKVVAAGFAAKRLVVAVGRAAGFAPNKPVLGVDPEQVG